MIQSIAFLKFLYGFGTYNNIKNIVKIVTLDDNFQSFDTNYCRIFQVYFYLNLFEPFYTNVVAERSTKKLDVKLIGELLNELSNTRTSQNERILDAFIMQHGLELHRDETNDQEEEKRDNSNEKLMINFVNV